MYLKDSGEQRVNKLKEMCEVELTIINNPEYGWELATALADKDNKKGLAALVFNVNDSEGKVNIFIWATKEGMYKKYSSPESGISELESTLVEMLYFTIAKCHELYVNSEYDKEGYYRIQIFDVPASNYEDVLKLLSVCLRALPCFYKKNWINQK